MSKIGQHPSERDFQNFILIVSKLEPMEFMGLVRIFNIDIFEDNAEKTPKTFEQILSEVLDAYVKASRLQRRNLMKILKAATRKKD